MPEVIEREPQLVRVFVSSIVCILNRSYGLEEKIQKSSHSFMTGEFVADTGLSSGRLFF